MTFENTLIDEILAHDLTRESTPSDMPDDAISRIAAEIDLDDIIADMTDQLTGQIKAAVCNYSTRDDAKLGKLVIDEVYRGVRRVIQDNWEQAFTYIELGREEFQKELNHG